MIIGNKNLSKTSDWVPCILVLGQSNGAGQAQYTRLQNSLFNYKGISTGYPTQRTSQAQFTSTTYPYAFIYYKGDQRTADFTLDNGAWQTYDPATNAITDKDATTRTKEFGPELSAAQLIYEHTGKEIFIIKSALGGTALSPTGASTNVPGFWNYSLSNITNEYFIKRAIRDFHTFRSGKTLRIVGVLWWQGEQDANNSISKAVYKSEFITLKNNINLALKHNYVVDSLPTWNLVKLKYNETAAETVINTALTELVSENSDCLLIDATPYPKKSQLTSSEASPLTLGAPTNADGGTDSTNLHNSYIAQLAVGEVFYNNILASGLI